MKKPTTVPSLKEGDPPEMGRSWGRRGHLTLRGDWSLLFQWLEYSMLKSSGLGNLR